MKCCVILIGVVRPSSKQIIENIQSNIDYFQTKYPNIIFDFKICSYKNDNYNPVEKYCKEKNIDAIFLPHIKDSDIPHEYILPPPSQNRYRMYYSMNHILQTLPNDTYDCVMRVRLDTKIQNFQIVDHLCDNIYYTYHDKNSGRCNDNIGYGTYKVMMNMWNVKNLHLKGLGNEEIVYKCVKKYNYALKYFNFHYILYQSDSEYFDGVKQWSRRNREWIYDGTTYIEGRTIS